MQHNIINGNTWYSLLCYGVLVQDIKLASGWEAGFIIKATERVWGWSSTMSTWEKKSNFVSSYSAE